MIKAAGKQFQLFFFLDFLSITYHLNFRLAVTKLLSSVSILSQRVKLKRSEAIEWCGTVTTNGSKRL